MSDKAAAPLRGQMLCNPRDWLASEGVPGGGFALPCFLFIRLSSDLVGCTSFVTLTFRFLTLTVPHRLFFFLACTWSENHLSHLHP